MTIRGTTTLGLNILEDKTSGADSIRGAVDKTWKWEFSDGTGTDPTLADMKWSSLGRTLAASTGEDIDLAGVLTDAYGTKTFVRVKGIYIYAWSTNTNKVNVSRPAANGVLVFLAASDGMPIGANGKFVWEDPAGVAVTAGTGDLLRIDNSGAGTSVKYDIVVVGASA